MRDGSCVYCLILFHDIHVVISLSENPLMEDTDSLLYTINFLSHHSKLINDQINNR